MKKEKTICWLLKIDKTQDIKFCKKYKNTNELSIVENKTIIDKLREISSILCTFIFIFFLISPR